MKSKKEVIEKEDAQKSEDQFPGYPLYPSSEDIMTRGERVSLETEGIPETKTTEPSGAASLINEVNTELADLEKESKAVQVSNDQVSEQEINQTINEDELSTYGDRDDEELKDRVYPVDFTGDDLDIPGSELDDEREETGNEDEENNSYSLGNLD